MTDDPMGKYLDRVEAERKAYDGLWPNACQKCDGWGVIQWEENQAPLGSGMRWMEQFEEPCECVLQGKCPRCGDPFGPDYTGDNDAEIGAFFETQPCCEQCGWNWGQSEGDAKPSF